MTPSDPAAIARDAYIAPTAIINNAFRPLLDGREAGVGPATEIGAGVWIGNYTTVGPGVTIGTSSILEDFVGIEPGVQIGARTLVASRSWVGIGARLGDDSVIKGYIGDHAQVGSRCRIFGDLVHRQLDPSVPWDDATAEEPAPILGNGVFVGWRALIVGGVNIGEGAYVCAGALITKDVPARHIARGRNKITHPDNWRGALGKSPFFSQRQIPQATPISSRSRRLAAVRPWVSAEPSVWRRRGGSSRR